MVVRRRGTRDRPWERVGIRNGKDRSCVGMDDDPASELPHARGRGTICLLLATSVACAVMIVEQWLGAREPEPTLLSLPPEVTGSASGAAQPRIAGYVGAAACSECHPCESALFARSGHHRTL